MYQLSDTIVAVSSASFDQRVIVRLSGDKAANAAGDIFIGDIQAGKVTFGNIKAVQGMELAGWLYYFKAPASYTGEDIVELHFSSGQAATEALISRILEKDVRPAGPGEFTARAYFNGKIDLAQAEAVNEIIVSSNTLQLSAAQKLLSGRLAEMAGLVRDKIMEMMSLLEAGLDFAHEDIEFVSRCDAKERLIECERMLSDMLEGGIRYEGIINLPSVGIAGAPNAGKSSLLNALLGSDRSIVSCEAGTTRDVLTGICKLAQSRCVLFDCAGLVTQTNGKIEELAQTAAMEALRQAAVVLFCVDEAKDDLSEDAAIRQMVETNSIIFVATKSDMAGDITSKVSELESKFGGDFVIVSSLTGKGLELLLEKINQALLEQTGGHADIAGLTARHREAVVSSGKTVTEAISSVEAGDDEVASMLLRDAYLSLGSIEHEQVDERILDRIFGSFCIGK